MKIVIEHARYAPIWETLQQLLRETTNNPNGKLTKIDREDNGTDYRQPGVYKLMMDQGNQTSLPITLEVVAVGHKPTIFEEPRTLNHKGPQVCSTASSTASTSAQKIPSTDTD